MLCIKLKSYMNNTNLSTICLRMCSTHTPTHVLIFAYILIRKPLGFPIKGPP